MTDNIRNSVRTVTQELVTLNSLLTDINNGKYQQQINVISTPGPVGPPGPAGIGINIKGTVEDSSQLPSNPAVNDAYINQADNKLFVYNGTEWLVLNIEFPPGPVGPVGPPGPPGQSSEVFGQSNTLFIIFDGTAANLSSVDLRQFDIDRFSSLIILAPSNVTTELLVANGSFGGTETIVKLVVSTLTLLITLNGANRLYNGTGQGVRITNGRDTVNVPNGNTVSKIFRWLDSLMYNTNYLSGGTGPAPQSINVGEANTLLVTVENGATVVTKYNW